MNSDNEIEVSQDYKYIPNKKLGSGAFGEIFEGYHKLTKQPVAVKREPTTNRHPQLEHESDIITALKGGTGFPNVYLYKPDNEYNYLVMDLLGLSIEELFEFCQRKFSLRTILLIALQMVDRIEYMHSKGFIHRDIKPDNFILGKENTKIIYIIDFGLSKRYIDQETGMHIYKKTGKRLTGTARYASLFTHMGIEQARRDDLESIAFCIAYFCRGSLPWQGLRAKKREEKYLKIKNLKMANSPEELLKTHPEEFCQLFHYVRDIDFEDKPDYDHVRILLNKIWERYSYGNNTTFDWSLQSESTNVIIDNKENANTFPKNTNTTLNNNTKNKENNEVNQKLP